MTNVKQLNEHATRSPEHDQAKLAERSNAGNATRSNETAPVYVAILTYNGQKLLERCGNSFAKQTKSPAGILIIDNGSSDLNEQQIIHTFSSHAPSFTRISKNCGYAKAFNFGLQKVLNQAPWVLTLNNDTELDPHFFEKLDLVLKSTSQGVGMFCPKIRSLYERDTIDTTGLIIAFDGMSTARGQYEKDTGQYDGLKKIIAPSGVAAIYRSAMLQEIGLFDEDFESYCEDTDIGLRGWLAGWDCAFIPECVVYHERSATFGKFSLKKLYLVERNHFWVALKNFPLLLLVFIPYLTLYRYFLQAVAVFKMKGLGMQYSTAYPTKDLISTTLKALIDASRFSKKFLIYRKGRIVKRTFFEILATFFNYRLKLHKLVF